MVLILSASFLISITSLRIIWNLSGIHGKLQISPEWLLRPLPFIPSTPSSSCSAFCSLSSSLASSDLTPGSPYLLLPVPPARPSPHFQPFSSHSHCHKEPPVHWELSKDSGTPKSTHLRLKKKTKKLTRNRHLVHGLHKIIYQGKKILKASSVKTGEKL